MRRWFWLLALAACDNGASAGGDSPDSDGFVSDFGPRPDMRPPDGGACDIEIQGTCVEPPPANREALCDYIQTLPVDCADRDGDCLLGDCALPEALDRVRDCDDSRPDVHPFAEEVCDGIDNDCDGADDEGFGVGDACEACGAAGKVECAVDDATATACSTEPRQSDPAPVGPERCNEADDDCDGIVDEDCAVELPDGARSQPRLCGERVVLIQDGAVWSLAEDAAELDPGPAGFPTCDGEHTAWLDLADADCSTPDDGPLRCDRAHLIVHDGAPRDVTGIDALGPPVMTAGAVYWHSIVDGMPTVKRTAVTPAGGIESPLALGAFSDPSRSFQSKVAVRAWDVADAPRVQLRGHDGARDTVLTAWASPGPPALSEDWLVFAAGADLRAIWAVDPLGEAPFQLTAGALSGPKVDGDYVVWHQAGPPASLQLFELTTGAQTTVAVEVAPDDYDLRDGQLIWLAPGMDGPTTLFRRSLSR